MDKHIIKLFGFICCLGPCVTLYYIFVKAYLNSYKTVVLINEAGEAHIELIMLIVMVPIIGIGMYYSFFEEEKEEKIVWRKVICNGCKKVINENEAWHIRFGKVPVPFCSLDCALWSGEQSINECNEMINHITKTMDNIRLWKSESNAKNI